jgi:hypothetical protein
VSLWELQAYSPQATSSSAKITIPRRGNYILAARVAKGPNYGTLYFNVSGSLYSILCSDTVDKFEWCEIGPFSLEAGEHSISVGGVGLVELDEFLIYSLDEGESYLTLDEVFHSKGSEISVSYEEVNPCLFKVYINANETFTLVFSETYNPLWKVFVNGEEVSSNIAYWLVNSFNINKTGQFTVTVYFTGQRYADIGITVSLVSFVSIFTFTTAFLMISHKRKSNKFWRLPFWKKAH